MQVKITFLNIAKSAAIQLIWQYDEFPINQKHTET